MHRIDLVSIPICHHHLINALDIIETELCELDGIIISGNEFMIYDEQHNFMSFSFYYHN